MRPTRKRGFSLLEVMLAIGILLACLTVLGEMAYVGRKTAEDVEQLTTAQLLCQTQLNSILAGSLPWDSADHQPIADAPGWVYTVEIQPLDSFDLAELRVTVSPEPTADDHQPTGGRQFTLVRWMRPSQPAALDGLSGGSSGQATIDTFDMGDLFP